MYVTQDDKDILIAYFQDMEDTLVSSFRSMCSYDLYLEGFMNGYRCAVGMVIGFVKKYDKNPCTSF